MSNGNRVVAIVAGAGSGRRMGADKTMLKLLDKPLIAWPVDVLQKNKSIDEIVVVLHKNNMAEGEKLVADHGWTKVKKICEGGELRQDSVRNGLSYAGECRWVLIQDGSRPFLTDRLIEEGLAAARETGAAIAAVPVKDTIKQSDGSECVTYTLDRSLLRMVQTPQVFRFEIIQQAYSEIKDEVTDDAALVERAGLKVKMYTGDYNNIKVTTPEDLRLAELIAGGR